MAEFTTWYFSGLGGWAICLLVGAAAVIWLLVDSLRRRLPVNGWRLGAFLSGLALLAPATAIKVADGWQIGAAPALATAGLLGALAPLGMTAAYAVRYRGLVGCVKGHKPYRAELRECPQCARQTVQGLPGIKVEKPATDSKSGAGRKTSRGASKSSKPRSEGWLVDDEGSVYQINQGETTIGRAPQNDIRLWEGSASRLHAKIIEKDNTFTIYDLGSVAGTWLNGQRVRHPENLSSGDVLTFGSSVQMTFTTQPGELK